MKIKFVFLLFSWLLSVNAFASAQPKTTAEYIGSWSNGRGFSLSITPTTITFQGRPPNKPEKPLGYKNLTEPGSTVYNLKITSPLGKNSYLSKFLSLSIKKQTQSTDMTLAFYKSLADMKAGKNPTSTDDSWTKDFNDSPTIERLAHALSEAFTAKQLGRIDRMRAFLGTISVRIEHSISGKIEIKSFATFEEIEKWLKKRETGEGPQRNSGNLQKCGKGVCVYQETGLLHNNLYLQKITYGLTAGQPAIKTIYIVDGD